MKTKTREAKTVAEEKSRIEYLDIAKAFAIILIVMGHALGYSEHTSILYKFIFSFHVVLFFILSGYTFNAKDDFLTFLKKRLLRIVFPYFLWGAVFLIPLLIFGDSMSSATGDGKHFDLKLQLLRLLIGNGIGDGLRQNSPLWFLPALFSTQLLYYFVIKFSSREKLVPVLGVIMLAVSFVCTYLMPVILPFGLNSALTIGIFFYAGWLFKRFELFDKEKLFKIPVVFVLLFFGVLSAYRNDLISSVEYKYGRLYLYILSGVGISVFVIYVSYLIGKSKFLEFIGVNTMGILVFHKIILLIFQVKMGPVSILMKSSNAAVETLICLLASAVSIAFSLICAVIIKRLFPPALGEPFKSKKD